jgi:UDP-2-acetamido-3-amino-2,3-dideoxy-glucuronate N-acetyltransferase
MKNFFTHKTVIIDKNAIIGSDTKIWHWSHISNNAQIGKNCTIGQNVFIGENVKIGNNVKIQNNVSVYQGVFLEDDVFCGPSVVFTNVKFPQSLIETEKKNYSKTYVKKGVTIGANSTIICGITINENAFIGAGAVITKDIDKNIIAVGNPAKAIGKICNCKIKVFKKPYNLTKCENCNFEIK